MKKIALTSLMFLSFFGLSSCYASPVKGPQGPIGPTGPQGESGKDGQDGRAIISIELTNSIDNIDTYTITYSDNTTSTFKVTNGKDGATGEQGIQGIEGEPGKDGHTPKIEIGSNGNWFVDGVDTKISSKGPEGPIGPQGEPGKDGATPIIGSNGNWWINGQDTGCPSKGQDGTSTSLSINDQGYRVINGENTNFKAEGNIDEIYSSMSHYFDLKEQFTLEKETIKNPSYIYTTSTFSGWTGSIGRPKIVKTLMFKVRARETSITSIKLYLNKEDKNGSNIITETINTTIDPFQEKEIERTLSSPFINSHNEPLYFGYACDAFCDFYSNTSEKAAIEPSEYQAIQCYITNGNQPTSLKNFIDVYQKPCRYIYVKIGEYRKIFVPNDKLIASVTQKVNVFLPDKYYLAVNDNFQLFYRGVVQAKNPYNYYIKVKAKKGNTFPRYYEWKPTIEDIGNHELTLEVRDNNNNLLGVDRTTLIVNKVKIQSQNQNILCVGDSLTSGGVWVKEGYRRFAQKGGSPIGDGLNYIDCVGTKKTVINDKEIGFEGYGGWTWNSFLSSNSPFYDQESKEINFKKYSERNNFKNIDYFYILLTRNGHSESFKTNWKIDEGHFANATKLIDRIHLDYPDAKIRCLGLQMPSQNGGMGTNYNSSSAYGDAYGMLVSAMHYNKTLEDFCKQDKYKNFVNYIDVAGQFDTDYNMPQNNKPANNRTDITEIIGTNGVHPTTNGYYQIGDAFYRSLYNDFKE